MTADLYASALAAIEARRGQRLDEFCREWGDDEIRQCGKPAEFILWGKLLPKQAFGPRCYDHAVKHIGHAMPSRVDQYAVYDLRPLAKRAADTDALAAVLERHAPVDGNCWACYGDSARELLPWPCPDAQSALTALAVRN